jgi:O-antigen ligase
MTHYLNLDTLLFGLILLYAFALPFLKATVSVFGFLILLVWAVQGDLRHKFARIRASKALTALLLFTAYMAMTLLWSSDLSHSVRELGYLTFWLLIPVIATSVSTEQIRPIISAFISGMLVSEILAYGMIFGFWTIGGHGPEYPSPFMHHVPYSIFLALTAMILLYRIFSPDYSRTSKALMVLFFLSVSGNLFFSIGRTGQLALLVGIVMTFILHYRLTWKSLLSAALLIALLFSAAYAVSDNFKERVHAVGTEFDRFRQKDLATSWGQRVCYWLMTYDVLKHHPFIGAGIGDLNGEERLHAIEQIKVYGYRIPEQKLQKGHLHNQFLMVAFSGGLIGLALFLLFVYRLIRLPVTSAELRHLSWIFLLVFAVGAVSESIAFRQYPMGLFVLFSALFVSASLDPKDSPPGQTYGNSQRSLS